MSQTCFHTLSDGRRIAYRHTPGTGPALVFLPGYMSDMTGGKASAVFAWAQALGRECLLFDYSGCGESSGAFAEASLDRWREEVVAMTGLLAAPGAVLIGSSMGGWLMVLAALELGKRIYALVGIAAAPDFTEWGYSADQKAELLAGRCVFEPNPYGSEPTPTHPLFWRSGQDSRVLGGQIALDCPVRLLHGQADGDVPWDIALQLASALRSAEVQVHLIKDGDHRLSRDQDIALLLRVLGALN